MNINELLKGIDNCECGRKHFCDVKKVIIKQGAIEELSMLMGDYRNPIIVCDETTAEILGNKVQSILGSKMCILKGSGIIIPDEKSVQKVYDVMNDCDYLIGVGSGVINDICKYVSYEKNMKYSIVATAPSMDGYASTAAAMLFGGLKTTFTTHVPEYIIADTDILKNAPDKMIKSGIGDILGKISCLNDWKLSELITGEYICTRIYNIVKGEVDSCINNLDGISKREDDAIGNLFKSLVTVGICMSFAGSSRPASGAEHHMSHFFEVTGLLNHTDYLPHGLDVGMSTAIVCKLREMLRNEDFSSFVYSYNEEKNDDRIRKIYGDLAEELIEMSREKNLYENRLDIIKSKEKEIKEILGESMSFNEYMKIAESAGLDIKELMSSYTKETIENCIVYAKDLKDRYSIMRILCNCGILEKYSSSIIENI